MNSLSLSDLMQPDQVLLILSAHCEDAELGCGGLLRRLERESRGRWTARTMVFTGGDDPQRSQEQREAAKSFGLGSVEISSYPDSLLPNHWHEIKDDLLRVREEIGTKRIGMVICPLLNDRHQDHRVVAENAWRVFRDHVILEYEILKYEGDWAEANVFVSLSEEEAEEKADLLMQCYPSSKRHHWWRKASFMGLMSLRGVQANSLYAEGLVARKLVF